MIAEVSGPELVEQCRQLQLQRRRLVQDGAEAAALVVAAAAAYCAAVGEAERQYGPAEWWSVVAAGDVGDGVEVRRVEVRAGASELQRLGLMMVASELEQLQEQWCAAVASRVMVQQQLAEVQGLLMMVQQQLAEEGSF
jgi:hypothetical protein